MGVDEAATLDGLIGQRQTLDRLIATHGGRVAASRTSRLKRLFCSWSATAFVAVVSIGAAAAQPKSGETVAQPKRVLFLHTFGPNFEQGAAWSREVQKELNRQLPWPLNILDQSHLTAEAARSYVGRRRRRSCRLN